MQAEMTTEMATDNKPFYQRWFRREGVPEVCNVLFSHFLLTKT